MKATQGRNVHFSSWFEGVGSYCSRSWKQWGPSHPRAGDSKALHTHGEGSSRALHTHRQETVRYSHPQAGDSKALYIHGQETVRHFTPTGRRQTFHTHRHKTVSHFTPTDRKHVCVQPVPFLYSVGPKPPRSDHDATLLMDHIPTLLKWDTPSQACLKTNLIYTVPERCDWTLVSYVNSNSVKLTVVQILINLNNKTRSQISE